MLNLSVVAATLILLYKGLNDMSFDSTYQGVRVLFGLDALYVFIGLFAMVRTYSRALAPLRQLQVKWVMLGVAGGLLPQTLLSTVPAVWNVEQIVPDAALQVFYAAIPLGFLASIMRYRLFDLDLICGRFAIATLTCIVVLATGSLLGAIPLPHSVSSPTVRWSASALIAGVPLVLLRRRVYRLLGVTAMRPEAFRECVHNALNEGGRADTLTGKVLSLIITKLLFERGAMFLEDVTWARFVCVAAMNVEPSPESPKISSQGPLATWLREERRAVRIKTYERPLGVKLLSASETEVLSRLDGIIAVPLRSQKRMVGFFVVSNHQNGAMPNSLLVKLLEWRSCRIDTTTVDSPGET
jgi:hypothetical protein